MSPEITPQLMLKAYARGIFPMAESRDDPELFWVDPKLRGILPLDGFHISRSLARRMLAGGFEVTFDRDFSGVVEACADRDETWINDTIFDLYAQLHQMGYAHSIEVWVKGKLIGGVYGITLGAAFFGESMFSRASDGSKIALAYLVDHLRRTGFELFDTQFITPHLQSLGGIEIERADYHERLESALQHNADFTAKTAMASAYDVIQRNTQTS